MVKKKIVSGDFAPRKFLLFSGRTGTPSLGLGQVPSRSDSASFGPVPSTASPTQAPMAGIVDVPLNASDLPSKFISFESVYKGEKASYAMLIDFPLEFDPKKQYPIVIIPPALGTRMTQFAALALGLKATKEVITIRLAFPNSNDETSGDISALGIVPDHLIEHMSFILGDGKYKTFGLQSKLENAGQFLNCNNISFIAPSMSSMLVLEIAERYIHRIKSIVLLSPIPDLKKAIMAKYPEDRDLDQDIRGSLDVITSNWLLIVQIFGKNLGSVILGNFRPMIEEVSARLSRLKANIDTHLVSYMEQKIDPNRFFYSVVSIEKTIKAFIAGHWTMCLKYGLSDTHERLEKLSKVIPISIIYPENDELALHEDVRAMANNRGSCRHPIAIEVVRGSGHDWESLPRLKDALYIAMKHTLHNIRDEKVKTAPKDTGVPYLRTSQIGMKTMMENMAFAMRAYIDHMRKKSERLPDSTAKLFHRVLKRLITESNLDRIVQELLDTPGELNRFVNLNEKSEQILHAQFASDSIFQNMRGLNIMQVLGEDRIIASLNRVVSLSSKTQKLLIQEISNNPDIVLSLLSVNFVWGIDIGLLNSILEAIKASSIQYQQKIYENIDPLLLEEIGRRRALETIKASIAKPINPYIAALSQRGFDASKILVEINKLGRAFDTSNLPVLDKASYFLSDGSKNNPAAFALDPKSGLQITSGGTTGKPSIFIKSPSDLQSLKSAMRFMFGSIFGIERDSNKKKSAFVISLLTQGSWVGGRRLNDAMSGLNGVGSSSPGPDMSALKNFLSCTTFAEDEIILIGYPSFVANVARMLRESLPDFVRKHKISVVCGGDVLTERMRDSIARDLLIDLDNSSNIKNGSPQILTSFGSAETDIAQAIDGPELATIRRLASRIDLISKIKERISTELHEKVDLLKLDSINEFTEATLTGWDDKTQKLFYSALIYVLRSFETTSDKFLANTIATIDDRNSIAKKLSILLKARENLKNHFWQGNNKLSSIFQYDPTRLFVETIVVPGDNNDGTEQQIVVTSTDTTTGTVLVRYAMDNGRSIPYADIQTSLANTEYGHLMPSLKLPFLFIDGRPSGVSFGGENLDTSLFQDIILQNNSLQERFSGDVRVEKAPEGSDASCLVNICLRDGDQFSDTDIATLSEKTQNIIWEYFSNDYDLHNFIVKPFGDAAKPIVRIHRYREYPFHSSTKHSS